MKPLLRLVRGRGFLRAGWERAAAPLLPPISAPPCGLRVRRRRQAIARAHLELRLAGNHGPASVAVQRDLEVRRAAVVEGPPVDVAAGDLLAAQEHVQLVAVAVAHAGEIDVAGV